MRMTGKKKSKRERESEFFPQQRTPAMPATTMAGPGQMRRSQQFPQGLQRGAGHPSIEVIICSRTGYITGTRIGKPSQCPNSDTMAGKARVPDGTNPVKNNPPRHTHFTSYSSTLFAHSTIHLLSHKQKINKSHTKDSGINYCIFRNSIVPLIRNQNFNFENYKGIPPI